eukprot:gnl/TRDRNA2_/TRDRNA2_126974_c2_seq1.p1 gnl/TRDRNA2_/TRDRNA2_126974_c2~~gnl/TRDRNA2_/TRDRNA2_126974_c2_seq1.p1  ORF type:complete len:453 (-),score=93.12 gnl/TRDRNA2_/TRDRNA2_126974_c2_seq1:60-1250(-)
MAPSQRMVLETGYECLYKAGWTKQKLMGVKMGTYSGDSGCEWDACYPWPNKYQYDNNSNNVTLTRLSYLLGLEGPNCTIDTACSASLIAINCACTTMKLANYQGKGEDNKYSLCFGILAMTSPGGWIGECAATMLSFKGRAFTFNDTADGFVRGEGCPAVHLELSDAGDDEPWERRIAAVLGTTTNQDGKSASLTAPHGPSQQACIRLCLREAGLTPPEVDITECHGTGTALGDPIEVGAVKGVMFNNRGDVAIQYTAAKSHTGHLEAAAGNSGFIKACLQCIFATATGNVHVRALNPHLDVANYPAFFNQECCDIKKSSNVSGVSSFGFGGANARGDVWGRSLYGYTMGGKKVTLDKGESLEWMQKVMDDPSIVKGKIGSAMSPAALHAPHMSDW